MTVVVTPWPAYTLTCPASSLASAGLSTASQGHSGGRAGTIGTQTGLVNYVNHGLSCRLRGVLVVRPLQSRQRSKPDPIHQHLRKSAFPSMQKFVQAVELPAQHCLLISKEAPSNMDPNPGHTSAGFLPYTEPVTSF